MRLARVSLHADHACARSARRDRGARASRRTFERVRRAGDRQGHGRPGGDRLHQWDRRRRVLAGGGGGVAGAGPAGGAHRRPATPAAGHRRQPDHRPGGDVRQLRAGHRGDATPVARRRRHVATAGRPGGARGHRPPARAGPRQPALRGAVVPLWRGRARGRPRPGAGARTARTPRGLERCRATGHAVLVLGARGPGRRVLARPTPRLGGSRDQGGVARGGRTHLGGARPWGALGGAGPGRSPRVARARRPEGHRAGGRHPHHEGEPGVRRQRRRSRGRGRGPPRPRPGGTGVGADPRRPRAPRHRARPAGDARGLAVAPRLAHRGRTRSGRDRRRHGRDR